MSTSPNFVRLPQGMAYGWWQFNRRLLEDLTFEIELGSGDERTPGRYFQLYQGQLGGVGIYFGFQTNIFRPGKGYQGKGLLFSRWKTRNNADAEAPAGGWVENSGHEDDFVGVRSLFNWTLGRYECRLRPVRDDQLGVWYGFHVRRIADGIEGTAGSLRFPLVDGQRPMIHTGGGSWTEVYGGGTIDPASVPRTHVTVHRVLANQGSVRPVRCDTDYNHDFPPADCSVTADGALHLLSGSGVVRQNPGGQHVISDLENPAAAS